MYGKQARLLLQFDRDLDNQELNFHSENSAEFVGDDEDSDEQDFEISYEADNTNILDVNRDVEAPADEIEDRMPRKQKIKLWSNVCNMNNYCNLPEQESETFVWSNKNALSIMSN